jgi:4-hydroxy-3-methylbut-2-enyl diphosphate reductase
MQKTEFLHLTSLMNLDIMKVLVAETCGFCQGVKNAIRIAEKVLSQEKEVYSLGPIIHNRDVVERLAKAGLKTVNSIEEIDSGTGPRFAGTPTVIIRSHGVAPKLLAELKKKGIKIVDATCVLVKRVQHIAQELAREGYRVVVIGDKNHPEVQAVVGCAKDVVVIADESDLSDKSDLHKLPKNARLGIVCQTTQSPEHFGRMLGAIGSSSFSEMKVINTLCQEAIKRQESAVQLCRNVDVMFVLGGLESANTRKLAELCKKVNKLTFHLQNWNELDINILSGKNIVGVTAGASTPEWIIDEFVKKLKSL